MIIRSVRPADVDRLVALYVAGGLTARSQPFADEIWAKIRHGAEFFLLAEVPAGATSGRPVGAPEPALLGSVMGGIDGRRGWVYRMVVAPEARRHGVARRLVEELERRLRAAGVLKMSLLVLDGNMSAMDFWTSVGFDPVPEVHYFSKLVTVDSEAAASHGGPDGQFAGPYGAMDGPFAGPYRAMDGPFVDPQAQRQAET